METKLRVVTVLKSRRSAKIWVAQLLLVLLTAFVCMVILPVLAKAPVARAPGNTQIFSPAVNSAVPSLPGSPVETQSLVQQGKALYKAGQFAEAVRALQQAAQIYQTQGDGFRQAITLSNLSLAYQQLGLWAEATKGITDSLKLGSNAKK